MSTSVLFDFPGPRSKRRHRACGIFSGVVLTAVCALVLQRLHHAGQLSASSWNFLEVKGTWVAISDGLLNTAKAALVAIAMSVLFGAAFALGRLSHRRYLRWPAGAAIEFFRAVPLLLLILVVYLGFGDRIGVFWSLTVGLMLYEGSVTAEIFRAGVQAVPQGQVDAAYAVGLRHAHVMRLIVFPQALRIMLPALISQAVITLKDTSLGLIISYVELTQAGKQIYVFYNNPLEVGVVIATIYVVINYGLSRVASGVAARQRLRTRGRPQWSLAQAHRPTAEGDRAKSNG